jgi:hypothetical protein
MIAVDDLRPDQCGRWLVQVPYGQGDLFNLCTHGPLEYRLAASDQPFLPCLLGERRQGPRRLKGVSAVFVFGGWVACTQRFEGLCLRFLPQFPALFAEGDAPTCDKFFKAIFGVFYVELAVGAQINFQAGIDRIIG